MSDHDHDHGHGHGHHPGGQGEQGLLARLRHLVAPHSHDAADSVDAALEADQAGIRAVKVSLALLLVTALAQAGVVAATGSTALLADMIHNFSDALTAIPLWIAFVLGRRAANRTYTYGYGRAEDLAGVFIVLMIAASAVVAGYESVRHLVDGTEISHPWAVAAAGIVGFAGNELVAGYRIRVGRRIGSAALVADGVHARTDGFTSLAVVAGAVGVLAGFPLADPLVGLLITLAILVVLRGAARNIYRRLMDAVDPELTRTAEDVARSTPGVAELDYLRLRWVGHRILAEVGIGVAEHLDLVAAHTIAHDVQHRLLHDVRRLSDATVHVSPQSRPGRDHHAGVRHHLQAPS
jgi:cation diffusion facilitator family transporter